MMAMAWSEVVVASIGDYNRRTTEGTQGEKKV